MTDLLIRGLAREDSLDELTALLHRAFAPLGRMGLTCSCIAQTAATTARRIARGTCFVALKGSRPVGTVTLERPDPASDCAWYRGSRTASVHQLGVEPGAQHAGCGTRLLDVAEHWAAGHGYAELALDTPQRALHLVDWYRAHGFVTRGDFQHAGKHYRSVVLAKAVEPIPAPCDAWRAPHRTFTGVPLR